MITKKAASAFNYCPRWDFNTAEAGITRGNYRARVCFVSTQEYRMYLVFNMKTLELHPYTRVENKWIAGKIREDVPLPNVIKYFRSEDALKEELTCAFFKQFPKAEECFYGDLPKYRDVLHALTNSPTCECLNSNFYLYSLDDETTVDDADGIVTILVDEGEYMLPYTKTNSGLSIQVYRGKLHPDSCIGYLSERFWDKVDNLIVGIQSLSWSGFRRFIDSVFK